MPADPPAFPTPQIDYRTGEDELRSWQDFPGIARLLGKVALAILISAAITFVWLPLGLIVPFLLACLGQGITLGIGLGKAFNSSRLRRKAIALPVAIVSGPLAVALVYFAVYLRDVVTFFNSLYNRGGGVITPSQLFHNQPFRLFDILFLFPKTGHTGFLGDLIFRLHNQTLANASFVHLLVTTFLAWRIARSQLHSFFCPSCGRRLQPKNAAVLPAKFLDPLVLAVKSNDVEQALTVTNLAANLPLGNSCAIARLFNCASCGDQTIDVVSKTYGRAASTSIILKPTKVTPELVNALQSEPVVTENPANE